MQNFDNKIVFFEKNSIFCSKLSKIAENFDHNIDPRLSFLQILCTLFLRPFRIVDIRMYLDIVSTNLTKLFTGRMVTKHKLSSRRGFESRKGN
jgi:hypothetical protein